MSLVSGNGTGLITITNNIINLAFTYNANSTHHIDVESSSLVVKPYNGVGSAIIDKMQVNFTKVENG